MSLLPGAFLPSLWDEESWNLDSFSRGSFNKVQDGYYSQGSLSNSFDRDYYQLLVKPNYQYTIFLTSDFARYGWNTFSNGQSLEFDIQSSSGTILDSSSQDFSLGSLYDDSLTFTSSVSETYYVDVHGLEFSGVDYALTVIETYVGPPNNLAVFFNALYSGEVYESSTVTATIEYLEIDGNSDGIVLTNWALVDGDGVIEYSNVTNSSLVLSQSDIGKTLYFRKYFLDDLGNLEVSNFYNVGIVGTSTVFSAVSYVLGTNDKNLTLTGSGDVDGTGNTLANTLAGNSGNNTLDGGESDDTLIGDSGYDVLLGEGGNDALDGGLHVDWAIFSGDRSDYAITPGALSAVIVGPDGTDTLTRIERLVFDDMTLNLPFGLGVSVDVANADPDSFMAAIRDFDGNDLGSSNSWLRIGMADIQNDGDSEYIFVNRDNGRWATVGPAYDGLIYFNDHGWGGDTRVVGIYIDPLVESGDVEQGGPHDSQRRFQNDLFIENINAVLHADDYDGDGLQEIYFGITDKTAYLHAYMHADGNIRYANYQSEDQVIQYLTDNGFNSTTWDPWLYGSGSSSFVFPETNSSEPSLFAPQFGAVGSLFSAVA